MKRKILPLILFGLCICAAVATLSSCEPVETVKGWFGGCDHSDTEKYTVKENEVASTCTTEGSYDEVVYCSVCNEELNRAAKTSNELGHTPAVTVKENEIASTCTTEGSYDEAVYCSVCNEELNRAAKTSNELGHTPAVTVKENEIASTCTTKGSYDEVVYCSVCNEEISRTIKIIAMHNYVNGVCSCGAYVSLGLNYELNEDGLSYCVTGIGACIDTDLIIPATYNDLPVTTINNDAFYGCSSLISITIPNSVTHIGARAFHDCSYLASITIPDRATLPSLHPQNNYCTL